MKIVYCLVVAVVLAACNHAPEAPSKNASDSAKDAQSKQTLENLYDTTRLVKNTATFHTIEIRQMQFVPAEVKVHKGDTVAWINNDMVAHDITEEKNKEWSSSPLPAGKQWQMVAAKSADYYCSIHMVMKGKIIVQ